MLFLVTTQDTIIFEVEYRNITVRKKVTEHSSDIVVIIESVLSATLKYRQRDILYVYIYSI